MSTRLCRNDGLTLESLSTIARWHHRVALSLTIIIQIKQTNNVFAVYFEHGSYKRLHIRHIFDNNNQKRCLYPIALHAVWSALCIIMWSVCLSAAVCLSTVTLCIVTRRVGMYSSTRLKVVPSCSQQATSYSLYRTHLLQDLSFSH